MAELWLMQNLLETAVNRARQLGAHHIHEIKIQIGAASDVTPESLAQAFEVVKNGTIAQDAHLHSEYLPIVCYCATCNVEFQPIDPLYQCPECHQPYCEIRQGQELELNDLEIS
ncbi:hydrogenase maturation nickel metallochaperone HypA [Calothrix sp. PCC 7507]|uniref:hydrogenase maturation nickel metallochaperone HypA n=1 Tax=Calothrix sp. PCC 7507 TaxID=99598 RepID=UPI00029EE1E9|nr:hydrogenase maturation nickel metallochaperone HypA [Calothrix sp. PCC 7507]AFY35277.1 hydrogenase nickel insertion protein HypA [Calothrix sp. PCC 7507]